MLSYIVFVLFSHWFFGNAPLDPVLLNSKEGLVYDIKPLLIFKVLVNTLQYLKRAQITPLYFSRNEFLR